MKPVLTVFFDGLKPESLVHMPFLNSLQHRRLKALLGYSIACHASMYSGVYPHKHLMWFVWQRTPATSPFRWLRSARVLQYADCLPMRLIVQKITNRVQKRTAFWGIPQIIHPPLRYWPDLDVSEKRFWDEDGYLDGYPTIFELLRAHQVPYEIVGMGRSRQPSWQVVEAYHISDIKPWTYLFIGEVDGLSHRHRQNSPFVIEYLKRFDAIVERYYREFEQRTGDFSFFAFSDHGHQLVHEKINLYTVFRQAGRDLNCYLHVIDANFARFWFDNEAERRQVRQVLARIQNGFVLQAADLAAYHVEMPDNRFGDLVFYLDAGSAFAPTSFGFGKKEISLHGYLPAYPDADGVFIANRSFATADPVELVDVLPSLLNLLALPIPDHVEGRVVWGMGEAWEDTHYTKSPSLTR
jgi:hypothetical protein